MIETNKIPKTTFKRIINEDDINLFLNRTKYYHPYKYYVFFQIMIRLGLRLKETRYINLKDFNEDYTKIRVRLCKSNAIITRNVPKVLRDIIKTYIDFEKEFFIEGYIFYAENKNKSFNPWISETTVINRLNKIRKELATDYPQFNFKMVYGKKEIHNFSSHAFRSYFITNLYRRSNNLMLTKEIIGHSSINTTENYVRLVDKDKDIEYIDDITKNIIC